MVTPSHAVVVTLVIRRCSLDPGSSIGTEAAAAAEEEDPVVVFFFWIGEG